MIREDYSRKGDFSCFGKDPFMLETAFKKGNNIPVNIAIAVHANKLSIETYTHSFDNHLGFFSTLEHLPRLEYVTHGYHAGAICADERRALGLNTASDVKKHFQAQAAELYRNITGKDFVPEPDRVTKYTPEYYL